MSATAQVGTKLIPAALEAARKLAQVFEKGELPQQLINAAELVSTTSTAADGGFAASVNFAKQLVPDLRSFMDTAGQYLSVDQRQLFDEVIGILGSDNPNIRDEDRRGILGAFESVISQMGSSVEGAEAVGPAAFKISDKPTPNLLRRLADNLNRLINNKLQLNPQGDGGIAFEKRDEKIAFLSAIKDLRDGLVKAEHMDLNDPSAGFLSQVMQRINTAVLSPDRFSQGEAARILDITEQVLNGLPGNSTTEQMGRNVDIESPGVAAEAKSRTPDAGEEGNSYDTSAGSIDEQAGELVKTLVELFTARVSLPNSFLNNGLKIAQALGIPGIPEPKDLTKWVTEKVVDKSGLKEAVANFIGGSDLGEIKIDNGSDGFILGFIKNRALDFMKNALVRIKDTNPEELAGGLSRSAFLFNNFGLGPAMSVIGTLPLPRFLRTAIAWALPAIGRSVESFGELDQQDRIKTIHRMLNPRTNNSPQSAPQPGFAGT